MLSMHIDRKANYFSATLRPRSDKAPRQASRLIANKIKEGPVHAGGCITLYSKATPSGSFSANHAAAASALAKTLR